MAGRPYQEERHVRAERRRHPVELGQREGLSEEPVQTNERPWRRHHSLRPALPPADPLFQVDPDPNREAGRVKECPGPARTTRFVSSTGSRGSSTGRVIPEGA